jgi:hypothetical protein
VLPIIIMGIEMLQIKSVKIAFQSL